MRGGLDDALNKMARRDELRRRAAHEATGTPAAVTELVEAIAAVVGRNPRLAVTVGVEGEGDPMVLRFFSEEGQVQVTAESTPAAPPRADFDVEVGEPVDEFPPPYPGAETPRMMSQDDQDRFGPAYAYEQPPATYPPQPAYYADPDTAERRYGSFDQPPYPAPEPAGAHEHDLGARMRDLGMASSREPGFAAQHAQPEYAQPEYAQPDYAQADYPQPDLPPHPLAPTPPPSIPPQTTRRIDPEQYRAPFEPTAEQRAGATERLVPPAPAEQRGMPTPLPEPIPLKVERPEETEMAARRLAALLRDDPTLLSQRPE